MANMPIAKFRREVESHLEARNITVTEDMRRVIRECWEDTWDVKHTILYILKREGA